MADHLWVDKQVNDENKPDNRKKPFYAIYLMAVHRNSAKVPANAAEALSLSYDILWMVIICDFHKLPSRVGGGLVGAKAQAMTRYSMVTG